MAKVKMVKAEALKVDTGLITAKAAVLQLAIGGLRGREASRDQIEGTRSAGVRGDMLPWGFTTTQKEA